MFLRRLVGRPSTTGPGEPVIPVFSASGGARLAWTQSGAGGAGALRFRLYVDGEPRSLELVQCSPSGAGDDLDCRSVLPTLAPGAHLVRLSAVASGDGGQEGPMSMPITVTGGGAAPGVRSVDGVRPPGPG